MTDISHLLAKKLALKEVEVWLNEQYLEIDKHIEALEAHDDRVREVGGEVQKEMEEGQDD